MKKFFSRLLPAILGIMALSATTAFAQVNADAKAVYDDMEAKSMLMSDANMYVNMNMIMSDGTDTIQMGVDMNMLCKNMNDPANLQYLSKATMNMLGETEEATVWYKDGYSYTDSNGQKIKMKANYSKTMTTVLSMPEAMTTSDLLADLYLTTEGDKRYLNYTFDDDKMNSFIWTMFDSMGFNDLFKSLNMNFKVYDIKGSYTLTPDNLYESATMSMGMDISMDGESISVYMTCVINMLNPGQPVQITFPDPAGYTDITFTPAAA